MKNLFKCLSVAALAGMLSLSTVRAAALSCPSGKTAHTNYYLFLAVNDTNFMNDRIDEGNYAIFSGAINPTGIPTGGSALRADILPIVDGTDNNLKFITVDSITKEYGLSSWKKEDFWQKLYTAYKKHTGYIYTEGDVSYIIHDAYYTYTDANGNGQSQPSNSVYTNLIKYLDTQKMGSSTVVQNLDANHSIVKNATNLPSTWFIVPNPSAFGQSTTTMIRVNREFATTDKKLGIALDLDGDGHNDTYKNEDDEVVEVMYTFSPAVYFTQYCADKTSSENPPTEGTKFTVEYHATNGSTDAPAKQEGVVGKKCVTIAGGPKKTGDTFLGWTSKKNGAEPEEEYSVASKYCGEKGDLQLYSVWKNPKTGVSSHVIAFGIMAVVAASGLIVAKKKNLFKQI